MQTLDDMEEKYIATVDPGSSKIALGVAKVTGRDVQVIYYKEHPSDGIKGSVVYNPKRASVCLKQAVSEAEEELAIKIPGVIVGLPRFGVIQETNSFRLQRKNPDECIGQEEIDYVKEQALASYPLPEDGSAMIYGAEAVSFACDGNMNIREYDAVGAVSDIIDGNFCVFVGPRSYDNRINIMLREAGLQCEKKYFLPAATADVVLTAEEKENGVGLIDMGAGVTSLTIYQGGKLRCYYAIPFGGKSITGDIKYECGFSEALAENIKLGFGACMPEKLQSLSEKILQIVDGEDGSDHQLPVKYLSEIITSRVKEIAEAMLFRIQQSGYADTLRNGLVLTGGCAELVNCANFIKSISGYNVRKGYPRVKCMSTAECPEILETSAVDTVAMMTLAAKGRDFTSGMAINPIIVEGKKKEEPKADEYEGTVFENKREGEEPDNKKKKPRAPKQENGGWLTSVMRKTKNGIVDTFGGLYEGMEE